VASRRVTANNADQRALFEFSMLGSPATPREPRRTTRRANPAGAVRPPGLLVLEFHETFDLPVAYRPTVDVPPEIIQLRADLLAEELEELDQAIERRDLLAIADALGDSVYVLFGTALTFGIDLDAALREVHRANMSKLGADGRPVLRGDGKVLKGPLYRPPNMQLALGVDGGH
jgi:hypothetical protein